MTTQLTESQRSLLSTSLRVAAARYEEHAIELTSNRVIHMEEYPRLADQFTRQQHGAMALAEMIENADAVSITTEDE